MPLWNVLDGTVVTLNFDAAFTSHLIPYPSALADCIDNALDAQLPAQSRRTAHLAALRDARVTVYEQIEETEHQLWSMHGEIDWTKTNACVLSAEDNAWLASGAFELVRAEGVPFNTRALKLLKKLELLRNWSRLIDHAISEIVRCSKRRRHPASQFLSKIRWHLVHGCHPPDQKPVHVSSHSRLGCAA